MGRERKGSIIEKNGKIYARIRFKDENGKTRELWKSANSKGEAKQKLKEILNQSESLSGKQFDALNMTLNDLASFYRKNYLHQAVYVGQKKVSGVRGLTEAECALKPTVEFFGHYKIKDITYGQINRYKQVRLSTPTKYGKQRSIASVNKELGKLKRMFNIAIQEQWLTRSPFDNGKSLIGQEEHRDRVLSSEEEKRLFQAIESNPRCKHLKGIVLLGLDCAMRRGEIFTLNWASVSFSERTIKILAFNTKTAKERTVGMTNRVFEELSNIWANSKRDLHETVFGVSVTIKTSWKRICKEAGIENFRFHDTRHTAISRLIRAGLSPVECMRISGHSTLAAFNIYANLEADSIFRAANALDKYLVNENLMPNVCNQFSESIN